MARKTNSFLFPAAAAAVCLVSLAGCNQDDPLLKEGLWHPIHVNKTNSTLMAANPADLVRGHGVQGSDGVLDAAAIDRLYAGKVKKLPSAGLSDVTVKSQGESE